jgi:hypothetical protein
MHSTLLVSASSCWCDSMALLAQDQNLATNVRRMYVADIAVRPRLRGGERHGRLGFGLDNLFNPNLCDLEAMGVLQLIDEGEFHFPWCTIRLEGNQILVPSRTTFIKVNFLGSAAAASPAPSIRTRSSTTSQLRGRLHPSVSRTVMSPLLLHVLAVSVKTRNGGRSSGDASPCQQCRSLTPSANSLMRHGL